MSYDERKLRSPDDVITAKEMKMKVNDIIEWDDGKSEAHRWRVRGIHLGALGVESLIEIENVSHKPGWTGEWETHQMMFVPECLLRSCKLVRAEPVNS